MGSDKDVTIPTGSPRIPWSDNRRRWVCRCAFLLFCLCPTVALLYLILHPFGTGDWEQWIELKLGLPATVGRVETPDPWRTVLRDLSLRDERQQILLTARAARIEQSAGWCVDINGGECVAVDALPRLLDVARRTTLANQGSPEKLSIHWGPIVIVDQMGQRRLEATSLELVWANGSSSRRAEMFLQTSSQVESARRGIAVTLNSHEEAGIGSETLLIETCGQDLPAWLMSRFVPEFSILGPDATFHGRIIFDSQFSHGGESAARCEGHFRNCDLSRLNSLAFDLTGSATLAVRDCQLRNGRIESMQVDFRCEDGRLDPRFLQWAARRLGATAAVQAQQPIRYSELAGSLFIERGKVQLSGDGPWWATDPYQRGLLATPPPLVRRLEEIADGLFELNNAGSEDAAGDRQVAFLRYFHLPEPLKLATDPQSSWR